MAGGIAFAAGELRKAKYEVNTVGLDALTAEPFTVSWREDGFDLPVPLSRSIVWPGWIREGRPVDYRTLDMLQPGETFENNCVAPGYRRVEWRTEGSVDAVKLRFFPQHPQQEAWSYELLRNAP